MNDKSAVEEFHELCRPEFQFLVEEYGFVERELGKDEEPITGIPFELQYVSPKTSVLVLSQSYGHSCAVLFGPTQPDMREVYRHYNLECLLEIRRPDLSLERIVAERDRPDLTGQIRHYSRALRECADDVLRGDLSILPQVAEISERRRKEYERKYSRSWFTEWKLVFHGCMAGWRRRRRAKGIRRR